jgi:hypothetical protein
MHLKFGAGFFPMIAECLPRLGIHIRLVDELVMHGSALAVEVIDPKPRSGFWFST